MKRLSLWLTLAAMLLLAACGPSAARYNNDGNEEFTAKNYKEALDDYIAAQRENPDLAEPYYNAGNTYQRQGDLKAAANQTQQALRTAGDELAPKAHYNLGNSFFQAQQWQEAIEAYKETLRRTPGDMDAKNNLELALKMLQQQQMQQQAQQQGGQGGQPQPQQGQGEDQQNQSGGQGDQQQGGSGSQPNQRNQSGQGGHLTPEEAEQLLDALGQDSQTLQERLQQQFTSPGLPPAQDW